MLRSRSSHRRFGGFLRGFAFVVGIAGTASASHAAAVFDLVLTGDSELVPTVGAPEPLLGTLRVEIADPSAALPTGLSLLDLDVGAGALTARLDDEIVSPGLGVRFPDGGFVIPTLFLVVDAGSGPVALAIPDVEGTAQIDEQSELLLEATFAIDADDPAGVVTVRVVAVPEPPGGPLAGVALLVLAGLVRLPIRRVGSSDPGAVGRGERAGVRESDT